MYGIIDILPHEIANRGVSDVTNMTNHSMSQ